MRRTWALCTAAFVSFLLIFVPVGQASAVDPSCGGAVDEPPLEEPVPWAQEMFDPVNQLWPFSTGAGVTVAVVDSGVDATHPQLVGDVVLPGVSYVPESADGRVDCAPHGTAVASVIAAQPISGFGFVGLARDATILPIRVSETEFTAPADEILDPAILAAGLDYAVANGARVVAISAVTYSDSEALKAAAARALEAGVIVVAGVGNGQDAQDLNPRQDLVPYSATYPGVIGVGSVDRDGVRDATSQITPYVDLVAPGVDVTAASIGGHQRYSDTGIAVGFVAATVALMLGQPDSDLRDLSGPQLVNRLTGRLLAATDGAVGGPGALAYGRGLVDPYRALTETPGGAVPLDIEGRQPPPRDEAAIRLAAERAAADAASMRNALILTVVAFAVVAAAFFLPRARRRKWRPGKEREMQPEREDKRPEFLPGEMLFRATADK